MRSLPLFALLMLIAAPVRAQASDPVVGRYRLSEGPDVAGELRIKADGHFQYGLAAGALDEQASGRWMRDGANIRLHTEPKPIAPTISAGPRLPSDHGRLTFVVCFPNGRGIPGVDLRIGFDSGDPIEAYTQEDGWTMPPGESRTPRWIEFYEPVHGIASPRFAIGKAGGATLQFVLTPNDLGVVDFDGALAEPIADGLSVQRGAGAMHFIKLHD